MTGTLTLSSYCTLSYKCNLCETSLSNSISLPSSLVLYDRMYNAIKAPLGDAIIERDCR